MCQTSCKTKTCDVSWFQLAIDSWNKSQCSSCPATSWGSMARAWHIAVEPVASVNMSVIWACLRRASFELTLAGSCCFCWTLDSIRSWRTTAVSATPVCLGHNRRGCDVIHNLQRLEKSWSSWSWSEAFQGSQLTGIMIRQLQGDGSYHLLNLFTSILGIQAPGHDKR